MIYAQWTVRLSADVTWWDWKRKQTRPKVSGRAASVSPVTIEWDRGTSPSLFVTRSNRASMIHPVAELIIPKRFFCHSIAATAVVSFFRPFPSVFDTRQHRRRLEFCRFYCDIADHINVAAFDKWTRLILSFLLSRTLIRIRSGYQIHFLKSQVAPPPSKLSKWIMHEAAHEID